MMKSLVVLLSLAWVTRGTVGINCFVCENQPTNRHCVMFGRIKKCAINEQACQNTVRRSGYRRFITKTCKQAVACGNNFFQNPRPAWFPSQCNTRSPSSVCRCCCSTSFCNGPAVYCRGPVELQCPYLQQPKNGERTCDFRKTTTEVGARCYYQCDEGYDMAGPETVTCQKRGNLADWNGDIPRCLPKLCDAVPSINLGEFECTDEFYLGSKCNFHCLNEEYEIYPRQSDTLTCERQRDPLPQWDKPKPCCARSCPPHALMDACIILDSSLSVRRSNWPIMINFVQSIIKTFEVSPDATQFAVFSFGMRPNKKSQILLNQFSEDREGLLEEVGKMKYNPSFTYTGRALRHARDVIFNATTGDRLHAKNVIIIITDGQTSKNDPAEFDSVNLRESGVLIFGIGVMPPSGKLTVDELDDGLREIVGDRNNYFIANEGFEGLNDMLSAGISEQICINRCNL